MSKAVGFSVGLVAGVGGLSLAGMKLFQKQMVKEIESPKSFEKTCEAIEKVIPEFASEGWGFPFDKWNFYKVFEDRNIDVPNIRKLTVYFVCNAKLAARVINENNAMAGIMPCSWAVMEKADGKTYIAKVNIGLMAKIFTGVIKETMEKVEATEKRMFDRIFSI